MTTDLPVPVDIPRSPYGFEVGCAEGSGQFSVLRVVHTMPRVGCVKQQWSLRECRWFSQCLPLSLDICLP
jgi:hypothetical protein